MIRSGVYILLTLLCLATASAQTEQFHFKRLDIQQGLSNNNVLCFLKDSQGFMWFGTYAGLNRFDGYTLKVFTHDIADSLSLINSNISKLYEGPDGKIWITTPQGINVYDPSTEKISRRVGPLLQRLGVPDGLIEGIVIDKLRNYWFLHPTRGLYCYRPSTGTTLHVRHTAGDSTSIGSDTIAALTPDDHGDFWVIHKNGTLEKLNGSSHKVLYRNRELFHRHGGQTLPYTMMMDGDGDLWLYVRQSNSGASYFHTGTRRFTHLQKETGSPRLNTNIIRGIAQDNKGRIWIGTDHGGINLVNKKDWTIQYLLHDAEDEKSLSQNTVNALYRDDQGIVWAGTYKDGISYYHEHLFRFPLYQTNRANPQGLPFNDINGFVEDDKGNLWMASNGGGLIYFDRQKNTFKQYLHQPGNPNSIGNKVIVCVYLDRDKKLWIGTYYGGLTCFDGKKFTTYRHNPQDPHSLSHDSIWEIFEDSKGNLWIGTLDGGLERFDRERKIFHHYPGGGRNSIHSSYVSEVEEDKFGNLWIGTAYGVEMLEPETRRVTHYLNNQNDPKSISNNVIHAILKDSRGLLWIGTASGLNLYDYDTQTFRVFRKQDGLPHNTILAMVEDNRGHLWMSTPNGLTKAVLTAADNKKVPSLHFTSYDESDGLQGREFNENAAFRTRAGELIFGGLKGFNIFNPETIGANQHVPAVVLSDFQLFNKSVRIGELVNDEVILQRSITETPDITLQHADNVFALEFVALNYLHPEKNQYRYMLEGFDADWIYGGQNSRRATYTNLDPGHYTFKVKASNNDGVWNDHGAAVAITILPPYWKTGYAFILYVLMVLLALLLARHILLLRERAKFEAQQEREEARRMHELDIMKIRFFTNVSHEFRTPLTLILTPVEKLVKSTTDPAQTKQFQLIQRNARRLLNLVNQLLDFRKLETQGIKYTPSEGDIIQFISDATYSFSDVSEKNDIRLSFHSSIPKLETLFDQDKLEKILFNLLSNAFKFTPPHGNVSVEVDRARVQEAPDENRWIQILVKDTGIGIPPEKHEKIFERFFQNDLPSSLVNQGSGIGLAITKEFVKIQGGTIHVASEPDKGSCFTVLLPLPEIRGAAAAPATAERALEIMLQQPVGAADEEPKGKVKKPILLLIEDNEDFRFYLKDNLQADYTIMEARNGLEGWQQATASIPDLIVSDIMMPEWNGIELCRKLKADERTSHIPMILLTARTAAEQKLEGYDAGAHDYVVKPFSFELLQSRIRNILRQQESARKAFSQRMVVKGSHIEVTSLDEKLIQKAIALVEKHMENPEFSVETFSYELGMSRIHLYRKIHGITGKAPIEFIRTIRLQHAAQLLEKSQLTVSEVAYRVGFSNPKYFTKYFKEEFNMLPSQYASRKPNSVAGNTVQQPRIF